MQPRHRAPPLSSGDRLGLHYFLLPGAVVPAGFRTFLDLLNGSNIWLQKLKHYLLRGCTLHQVPYILVMYMLCYFQ